VVWGAVEGLLDQAMFERLVRFVRGEAGPLHRTDGKGRLLARLRGFNQAARLTPWFVLVDLNGDEKCAPPFRRRWLPSSERLMCFRVAVRAAEAWLLADRDRFSAFLDIPPERMPERPDSVSDPKRTLVNLARRSRRRDIREDMVPRAGSGRAVGPLYTSRLIEFVHDARRGWRPGVAARASESLDRSVRDLRRVVAAAMRVTP
jgi:hypothetical protein